MGVVSRVLKAVGGVRVGVVRRVLKRIGVRAGAVSRVLKGVGGVRVGVVNKVLKGVHSVFFNKTQPRICKKLRSLG